MNIVVENSNVSKVLLQKRCFNYFVNFIPNEEITSKQIPIEILKEAKNIAHQLGGFAIPGYDAVDFDPEITKSIHFAFGGFVSFIH